jgi:hypothetical protein
MIMRNEALEILAMVAQGYAEDAALRQVEILNGAPYKPETYYYWHGREAVAKNMLEIIDRLDRLEIDAHVAMLKELTIDGILNVDIEDTE